MVPYSIGETLTWATVRVREHKNVNSSKTMKVGIYKQALCKVVVSFLPECFMRTDTMSGWETLSLPSMVKTKPVEKILIEATVRS